MEQVANGEGELTVEVKNYETDYKFEIKNPDILFEVAKEITSDPDYVCRPGGSSLENSIITIGTSGNEFVSKWPRFYVRPARGQDGQVLFFNLSWLLHDYTWERICKSERTKRRLGSLLREHVNKDLVVLWGKRQITIGNEIAAYLESSEFYYQFRGFEEVEREGFIADLNEALKIQQIVLTEVYRFDGKKMDSPGLVIGNPYLYPQGGVSFGARDKFEALRRNYLANRIEDVGEARRIFADLTKKLEEEELRARKAETQLREIRLRSTVRGVEFRVRRHGLRVGRESETYLGYCAALGIDPKIFDQISVDDGLTLINQLRRFWSHLYHPDRGGSVEVMAKLNDAADKLEKVLKPEKNH